MTDTALPAALAEALDRLLDRRSTLGLAAAADTLSRGYRAHRPSSETVAGEGGVLAYAASRMPATFAAAAEVLSRLAAVAPDFRPASLLDAGAGPGTASWAATAVFPSIARATLLELSPEFRRLAATLAADAPDAALTTAAIRAHDLRRDPVGEHHDLAVAGYALTEIADAELPQLALRLVEAADVLVIVEPGTPRDFARLVGLRTRLVAEGARVLAPCPQDGACPLAGSAAGDWCHFSVRLPRRRTHMRLKGAVVPFEDERFSYLVVAAPGRGPDALRPAARILRPPEESRGGIALTVCDRDGGHERREVARRDKARHARVRRLGWGDGL